MPPALLHDSVWESAAAADRDRLESWPTLLVVDGDFEIARTLVCHFEKRGFHVASVTGFDDAREMLPRRRSWTLVIADFHLPDGTGLELHAWLGEHFRDTPLLLMCGSPFSATLCAGLDFVMKPFTIAQIDDAVRIVVSRR
jgi:DNA-binding response OmpR family regulator